MLVLLAAIPIFIGIAVKLSTPRPGEGPPFISELTGNGLFLAFTALSICLPVFLPLAVAVVTGDAVAGEAGTGTLRYLLTVPISRTRLLAVKSVGVLTYVAAAVLLITVVGLATGAALFGTHGVTLVSGDTVSIGNGLARSAAVALYVFIDLVGLAAIGLFFSTLTEVPVGAMAATVVVAIIFAVLDSVPQLGSVRGALLTHHWLGFTELLRSSPDALALLRWSLLPLAYAAVFGSAAWARITTADVTA
jgi:ABC-2 type transport system permease protein